MGPRPSAFAGDCHPRAPLYPKRHKPWGRTVAASALAAIIGEFFKAICPGTQGYRQAQDPARWSPVLLTRSAPVLVSCWHRPHADGPALHLQCTGDASSKPLSGHRGLPSLLPAATLQLLWEGPACMVPALMLSKDVPLCGNTTFCPQQMLPHPSSMSRAEAPTNAQYSEETSRIHTVP